MKSICLLPLLLAVIVAEDVDPGLKKDDHHVYYSTVSKKSESENSLESIESITNDSLLLKSLKSLKIVNSQFVKKKNVYPGIVIQNLHEKQLSDDILNDLTKFGAYSKLLSQLMHSIGNKELGLTQMQQFVDKSPFQTSTLKFDNIIDDIADKVSLFSPPDPFSYRNL